MTETQFIYLIQKEKLRITIIMVMLLLFSPISCAVEFNFDFPASVKIEDSFNVNLEVPSEEIHDVKIFVHKSETDKASSSDYISEIYNDGWKSSWNYIKEAFPEKKVFKVRVVSNAGERKICVRLRKSGSDSASIKCDSILVKEIEKTAESDEGLKSISSEKNVLKVIASSKDSSLEKEQNQTAQISSAPEKIYLKSPTKSTTSPITTQKEKIRNLTIYFITFILGAISILIVLRKL